MEKTFKISKTKKKIGHFIDVIFRKKRKQRKISFEVHITDGCNLNCKGCFHYSPLASAGDSYPLQDFERDFSRLSTIFKAKAKWIHIMGGEPLLNPNVTEYLSIARKNFPKATIQIVTNGILLRSMPKTFFDHCRTLNIEICVTVYPIGLDYQAIETEVTEHGCKITMFGNRSRDTSMMHASLRLNGKGDYRKSFIACGLSNQCVNLRKGTLYICSNIAYIDILNKSFQCNFDQAAGGISIYRHSRSEILDFLRRPNVVCRYCDMKYRKTHKTAWEQSKRSVGEWILDVSERHEDGI